jgi:hypothetical protein
MALQSFFYDGQIRRFVVQFIRMVSNFQVEFGKDRNGVTALQRVPVIYGDSSRQAASIIKQNSENFLNSVPAMAVYISDMKYARDRVQNPTFTSKLNLRERSYDPMTGGYSTQQGDTLTVERLMPVPYNLTIKLDIWTSNTEQKLQLIEQICTLFNPALEIQSTDNFVDWSSLSYVLLTDMSLSSRTIPIGTENPIDIATLTFELPIWISAPALVKKMGVIQKIIASVYDANGDIEGSIYDDAGLLSRQYITPLQYGVVLLNNQLQLLSEGNPVANPIGEQVIKKLTANVSSSTTITVSSGKGIAKGMEVLGNGVSDHCVVSDVQGNIITTNAPISANIGDRISFTSVVTQTGLDKNWRDLVNVYGNLTNGTSQVKLELDDGNEIVGTVAYNPADNTTLLWTADIDTLPVNTLSPVTAIIDPQSSRPGADLNTPSVGTRYLLVNDYISSETGANAAVYNWNGVDDTPITAYANDIIEYNGSHWIVSFDSTTSANVEYVTNLTTTVQYRWSSGAWSKSYEGAYKAGKWQLIL